MAKMTDEQAFINDFITIETKFNTPHDNGLETSAYTGVQDFFETHLQKSLDTGEQLHDIDVFKVKIGEVLRLYPSKWAIQFSEQHNLTETDTYNYDYRVTNIEIKMYSSNPIADGTIPKLKVDIFLERA